MSGYREYSKTLSGRQKPWCKSRASEKPTWTPKEPILKVERPVRNVVRRSPTEKVNRNRMLCQLRALGWSTYDLGREFKLHPGRVRNILDENMTPEEAEVDERITSHFLQVRDEEGIRAAELRRSGMKFADVAKAIGRSLMATSRLLKLHLGEEEMARLAAQGKAHNKGNFKADALPKSVRRRELKQNPNQLPPLRRVLRVEEVECRGPRGESRRVVLECGHAIVQGASHAYRGDRKRCPECAR